jgi:lysophospholipase L1-like esterase
MFHNTLVVRNQLIAEFYSVGAILVDGVEVKTFNWSDGYNVDGIVTIELRLSTGSKTVTIVFPYWTGFELRKIEVNTGATVTAPSRPATKIGVCGDSITHGAIASKVTTTWAYLLAIAKNKQLVNIANGGTTAVASHGSALSGLGCDVVTYMIGYNDFVSTPQTTLANFQIAVQGWITNARAAVGSSVPIHVISPIYSPNSGGGSLTLAQYRSAVLAAELAAGDANTFYINGLDLIDSSNYSIYLRSDGVHPNDAGSLRISNVLTPLV